MTHGEAIDLYIADLAPNRRPASVRRKERSDKIVWNTVKAVAERAGVRTHVHALRAAFAVQFDEQHPDQVIALKELMGHSRLETTLVYLRRKDKARAMETVRDLSFGFGALSGEGGVKESSPGTRSADVASAGSALHPARTSPPAESTPHIGAGTHGASDSASRPASQPVRSPLSVFESYALEAHTGFEPVLPSSALSEPLARKLAELGTTAVRQKERK